MTGEGVGQTESLYPWLDATKTRDERVRAAVERVLESYAGQFECGMCGACTVFVGGAKRCSLACPLDYLETWFAETQVG